MANNPKQIEMEEQKIEFCECEEPKQETRLTELSEPYPVCKNCNRDLRDWIDKVKT